MSKWRVKALANNDSLYENYVASEQEARDLVQELTDNGYHSSMIKKVEHEPKNWDVFDEWHNE